MNKKFWGLLGSAFTLATLCVFAHPVWAAVPDSCDLQTDTSCKTSCSPFTDTQVYGMPCGDTNAKLGKNACCQKKANDGINTPNYCETQWHYTCKAACDGTNDIKQSTIDCGDVKKNQGQGTCCQAKPSNSTPAKGTAQPGSTNSPYLNQSNQQLAIQCVAGKNVCTSASQCATSKIVGSCSTDGSVVCCSGTNAPNTSAGCSGNGGTCTSGMCPAGTNQFGACSDDSSISCCVQDKGGGGSLQGVVYTAADCGSQQGTCRFGSCVDPESAIGFCNQASGATCCKVQPPSATANNITSDAACFSVQGATCVGQKLGCTGGAQPIGSCTPDTSPSFQGGPNGEILCCAPPGADLSGTQAIPPDSFGSQNVGFDALKSFYGFMDPLNLQGANKGPHLVNRLVTNALPVIGLVFLVVIIISGVMWLTAGGDTKRVTAARTLLVNSVIGIFIVVFAYAIISNIIQILGQSVFPTG